MDFWHCLALRVVKVPVFEHTLYVITVEFGIFLVSVGGGDLKSLEHFLDRC